MPVDADAFVICDDTVTNFKAKENLDLEYQTSREKLIQILVCSRQSIEIDMKFSLSGLACLSAAVISLASSAMATNSHFATGDLLLTFQKVGSTNTVYADLGSAASFRGSSVGTYASNQINFLDLNAVLTSAFGAGWASDPNVYSSLAGVYASSSISNTVVNGDASRTLYVSASRNDVGTSGQSNSGTPTVGSNTDMTTAAASILSQNSVFADVPISPNPAVGYDAQAVVSETSISKIDDQQPITVFGGSNIQGTAFGVFGGGISQAGSASSFGTLGVASNVEFALDLYRIVAVNGKTNEVNGTLRSGDFQGTVTVNSSGKVSFVAGVVAVTDVIPAFTTQPSSTTINSGSTATFTVATSGTSPTFQWYTGTSGDITNPISGATAASYTTTALTATTSFWVRAHNTAGNADSNTATATVITAPAITSQPSSTTIISGSTATFTVAVSGSSPTFQWYRGNSGNTSSLISGATAASYTSSALTAATSFWLRVTNSAGQVDSTTATATVVTALAFTTQPSSTTINSGLAATFSVAVSGTSPTYQWYAGISGDTTNPISGATSGSYTTSAITATASFWLRASNFAGSVDSNTVIATVVTTPRITEQPKAKWLAIEGDGVNMSVDTTGINLSYQWRKNGVDLVGKKQKTLVLTGLKLSDTGSYSVVVSNSAGSVTSTASSLTVYSYSGDDDGDGLSNYDELVKYGTDPSLSDTDGDGLSDTFERAFVGKVNPTWLRVGDQITLDFKRLGRTGSIKLIGKLPNGLKFDSSIGILSGKIIGNSGLYSLALQFTDGKKISSIPFLLSVSAFPSSMVGSYAALLDDEDGYPVGMVSITVSAPGVWSGTLDLAGSSQIMSAKGSFSLDPCESKGRIALEFPMQNHIDMVLDPASPLISGTHLQGTIRGFRIAKGRELPWRTSKLTVSIAQDVVQDGFVAPAGLGWATGSVSPSGAILLSGQLGDATPFQTSIKISATGQAILWMKPYQNTLSSLGGVVSLLDSGINVESIHESLLEGLWWSRVPDATELSYASGFGPISASMLVSTYSPAGNVTGFLKSLGLTKNLLAETSMIGGGLPNLGIQAALPHAFKLDDGFNLVALPNQGMPTIPWKGALKISDGSFGGALMLPGSSTDITAGSAQVSGVFLQNQSLSSKIGIGLVKIPVNGPKGSYRTAAIVIDGNN